MFILHSNILLKESTKINLFVIFLCFLLFFQTTFSQVSEGDDYDKRIYEREQFILKQNFLKDQNNISSLINSKINNTNPDSIISNIIANISVDSVTSHIQQLQNFGSRFMLAQNRFEVSEWIQSKFISMGFNDVEYDTFYAYTNFSGYGLSFDTVTTQRNVIATLHGGVNPEQVYIFCGHYDSFNQSSNILSYAPGADDDESGTAAVLEIARAMMKSNYIPKATIKFIAFAAEELMNFGDAGSEHYALKAYNEGMDIRMVNNHDMISYTSQSLENSYVDIGYNPGSGYLSDMGVNCVERYTSINGFAGGYAGADLRTFDAMDYKGVYFEENEFSPYYHTGADVIENYNMEYCTEVIKASCATSISAMLLPKPVDAIFFTDLSDGSTLKIDWTPYDDVDLNYYNMYIGTETGSYDRVYQTNETSYIVDNLESGSLYYFGVSIVNNDGYESYIRESIYIPYTFTLDQGILVIDDTFNGNGTIGNPTDEEVDEYFRDILYDFEINEYDVVLSPDIQVSDIGKYSTIIWHKNDYKSATILPAFSETLQRYINAGGNFIFTGFVASKILVGNFTYPSTFSEGDLLYDLFKIENVEKTFASRFYGAKTDVLDYLNIYVDTNKTTEQTNYHLRNIESIDANINGNNIYYYDTKFDTSTPGGRMLNLPVGVEYIGNNYKTVILSFPMYYMDMDKSKELLHYILNDKFNELTDIDDQREVVIDKYRLFQNYPNPFNPITTIEFSIAKREFVSVNVYDLLGSEVANLIKKELGQGTYSIEFSASGGLSSGIYFYKIEAGSFVETKKMVLLR